MKRNTFYIYTVILTFGAILYLLLNLHLLFNKDISHNELSQADTYARMYRSLPIKVDLNFLRAHRVENNELGIKDSAETEHNQREFLREQNKKKLIRDKLSGRTVNKQDNIQHHVELENADRKTRGQTTGLFDRKPKTTSKVGLLTLFTTMKDIAGRELMHANVLQNWASLGADVNPVMFSDAQDLVWGRRAYMSGWQLRQVPRLKRGLPILKDMYLDLIHNSTTKTHFYAYANSDILFDHTLVETLQFLRSKNVELSTRLLVSGRRINVNMTFVGEVRSLEQVGRLGERGELGAPNAQDYFITTAGGVPWGEVVDLVVGRPGFDNWLVAKAPGWDLTGVDASETITAIHQTGEEGNQAGWHNVHDLCINRRQLAPFDYQPGFTHCMATQTGRDAAGSVVLNQRTDFPATCVADTKRANQGVGRGNPCP